MSERIKIIPGADMLLLKNGQVLMMLRKNTKIDDEKWGIPSGHVEGEESPLEAAIRETKEEVGVSVLSEQAKFVHTTYKVDKTIDDQVRVNFTFISENWLGAPSVCEPDKCGGVKWFDLNNLPENISFHANHVLTKYRSGDFYSYVLRIEP